MTRIIALALLIAAAATGAIADEQTLSPLPPPAAPKAGSLEAVMGANTTCASFTNGCEICTRAAGGPRCSTPGPTCQPVEWRCDEPAKTP